MAPRREGTPVVVRLPDDLLAQIDARREKSGLTRAEAMRRMLRYALAADTNMNR